MKNFKRSQTLSHLFSQGLVSALSLRGDSVYRENFIRAVQGINSNFVPIAERAPEVVVYAIGVQKDRPVPLGLPSFSKVVTAYRWPVDEFSERLTRAGFTEVERLQRPSEGNHRPHAAIAAIATEG